MAKVLNFFEKGFMNTKQIAKFFAPTPAGTRIVPAKTRKKNAHWQMRVDKGEEISGSPGVYNVYLQVNHEATNKALLKWKRKNPHGNLAVGTVDINIPNEKRPAYINTMMSGLMKDARKKL